MEATRWPLVGRQTELSAFASLLDDPDRNGIVLVGASGVGKTRLAREMTAMAADAGHEGLQLTGTASLAAVPFGALAPLVADPALTGTGLLASVRREVVGRSPSEPLCIHIDDAHLLDDLSAGVIQQLTADGTVLVIATVRSGRPTPPELRALWTRGHAERLDVAPLDDAAVLELIELVLGNQVETVTAQRLVGLCQGNVLALRQLLLAGIEGGALRESGGVWRLDGRLTVSERLDDLVRDQLDGLDDDDHHALELLALAEPLGLDTLVALAGHDRIEALEARELLQVRPGGQRTEAWFVHPLTGEVLREGVPHLRRRRLLLELLGSREADWLATTGDLIRLATWKLDAGLDVDPDEAIAAARLAARTFREQSDLRLARSAWDTRPDGDSAVFLGWLLRARAMFDEADIHYRSALRSVGSDRDRVRITYARAETLNRLGRSDDAIEINRRGRDRFDTDPLAPILDAQLVSFELSSGRPARAIERAAPFIDDATDRPDLFLQAAVPAVMALSMAGRTDDALALCGRTAAASSGGLVLLEHQGVVGLQMVALAFTFTFTDAGRLTEARVVVEAMKREVIAERSTPGLLITSVLAGRICLVEGTFAEAARRFQEAVSHARSLHEPAMVQWAVGGAALAHALAGEPAKAAHLLDHLAGDAGPGWEPHLHARASAWVAEGSGDRPGAVATLDRAVYDAADAGHRTAALFMAHDLAMLGAVEASSLALAALGEQQSELAGLFGAHVAGLEHDDAEGLDATWRELENMDARWTAAVVARDLARLHQAEGRARAATTASNDSRRLSDTLDWDATTALDPDKVAGLSGREIEIAQLAAGGASNKDIAADLFLSIRTVENHLRRIYKKLGIANRGELADVFSHSG